jgi:hypothetical protein
MAVRDPYQPPAYPAIQQPQPEEYDLPPDIQAQIEYARMLDQQKTPMADPMAQSGGLRVGRFNVPGSAIDRASPALLAALQGRGPAVQKGRGHDLANILSVLGQTYLGSRVQGARERQAAHEEDLDLAKEMRGQQGTDRREAHQLAGSTLARYRWEQAKRSATPVAPKVVVTPKVRAEAARNGVWISSALDGTEVVPGELTSPVPKDVRQPESPMANAPFANEARVSRSGIRWLDSTNLPSDAAGKRAALEYAAANGLKVVDKGNADRLLNAEEVYRSLDNIESLMPGLLAANPAERLTKGPANIAASLTQSNSDAAAFRNTQIVGIRVIQALAAGQGSGFRLNQAEINAINSRWPKLTDDIETATKKLEWERVFLENKEGSYFGLPPKPLPRIMGFVNPAGMPSAGPENPMALKKFKAGLLSMMGGTRPSATALDSMRIEAKKNGVSQEALDAAEVEVANKLPAKGKR